MVERDERTSLSMKAPMRLQPTSAARYCCATILALHRVAQGADAADFDLDDVAGLEEDAAGAADAGGGAGGDDIAGLQGVDGTAPGDGARDGVDHLRRRGALALLAVDARD